MAWIKYAVIVLVAVLIAAGGLFLRYDAAKDEKARQDLKRAQDMRNALERARDADVSNGDPDDTLKWLRERPRNGR